MRALGARALLAIAAAAFAPACQTSLAKPPVVFAVGDRRQVVAGDLTSRIALEEVRHIRGLYALGPAEELRGEITVIDGDLHISVLNESGEPFELDVQEAWRKQAVFLAYASAPEAGLEKILQTSATHEDLRKIVEKEAESSGLDIDSAAFVVVLEGIAEEVGYHIIWATGAQPHNAAEHKRSKAHFLERHVPVTILGIYSRPEEGVITHPGNPLHLHVVINGKGRSGHLDQVRLLPGTRLRLPNSRKP